MTRWPSPNFRTALWWINNIYIFANHHEKNIHLLRKREEKSDMHVFQCLFSSKVDFTHFIDNSSIAFRKFSWQCWHTPERFSFAMVEENFKISSPETLQIDPIWHRSERFSFTMVEEDSEISFLKTSRKIQFGIDW